MREYWRKIKFLLLLSISAFCGCNRHKKSSEGRPYTIVPQASPNPINLKIEQSLAKLPIEKREIIKKLNLINPEYIEKLGTYDLAKIQAAAPCLREIESIGTQCNNVTDELLKGSEEQIAALVKIVSRMVYCETAFNIKQLYSIDMKYLKYLESIKLNEYALQFDGASRYTAAFNRIDTVTNPEKQKLLFQILCTIHYISRENNMNRVCTDDVDKLKMKLKLIQSNYIDLDKATTTRDYNSLEYYLIHTVEKIILNANEDEQGIKEKIVEYKRLYLEKEKLILKKSNNILDNNQLLDLIRKLEAIERG